MGESAADLAPVLHLPIGLPVRALNIDLSTVSAASDLALGFGAPLQEIVDINFQSGQDANLDGRLLLYNVLYHHHYPVPVRTILILLRPAADHSRLTGRLTYQAGASRVEFEYEVLRLWQQPLDLFLGGGLGLLPLAPLCQLPEDVPLQDAMKSVVHQIDQRLAKEAPDARAAKLMTAAFVLAGLRVGEKSLANIFQGVTIMHESSAFTLFEEKGRVEESRRILLRVGTKQFGPPDPATEATLQGLDDLDRLERMADALVTAQSWQELLATP